jgi:hypothetical protein
MTDDVNDNRTCNIRITSGLIPIFQHTHTHTPLPLPHQNHTNRACGTNLESSEPKRIVLRFLEPSCPDNPEAKDAACDREHIADTPKPERRERQRVCSVGYCEDGRPVWSDRKPRCVSRWRRAVHAAEAVQEKQQHGGGGGGGAGGGSQW